LISVLPQVNDQSIAAGRTMTFSRHERGDRGCSAIFELVETRLHGGVGGLELRNVVAKYPFERSRSFPVIQPNSGRRD
jgi:hypothetical protein